MIKVDVNKSKQQIFGDEGSSKQDTLALPC
jgi:hypothetical protein